MLVDDSQSSYASVQQPKMAMTHEDLEVAQTSETVIAYLTVELLIRVRGMEETCRTNLDSMLVFSNFVHLPFVVKNGKSFQIDVR